MKIDYEIQWTPKVMNGLVKIPDTALHLIAKQTLDLSIPIIPKDTKTMSKQTMANGVRGGHGDYYIKSTPNYASSVWKMTNVNWTTPGTNNKWFVRALKKHGTTIISNAINQSWKKDIG